MINYVGAKAVPVPLRKEFGFRLDAGELADSINDRTKLIILNSPQNPPGGVLEKRSGLVVPPYGPKFTVTVLEQVWVPASHTLYVKLRWPVVPVESSYKPSFGVVAITTPSRLTSTLAEVAPLHFRRDVFIPPTFFPWPLS